MLGLSDCDQFHVNIGSLSIYCIANRDIRSHRVQKQGYQSVRQSAFVQVVIIAAMVLVSACASVAPQPPAEPQEQAPAAVPKIDVVEAQQQRLSDRQEKINALLALAEEALSADRLMHPAEDNAFDWYQQVIALDELNADAHWGMRRITLRYFELAKQAFASGQSARAEQMLHGALQVAATPAQVDEIRAAYRQQFADKTFALSPQGLSSRSSRVQEQLAEIARRAREQESRLLIVARSDAEGRWIYAQMRAAVDGYRLRGNIEVGEHPHIVLVDL